MQELALFILPRSDDESDDDGKFNSDIESNDGSTASEDVSDDIKHVNSRILSDLGKILLARTCGSKTALKDFTNRGAGKQEEHFDLRVALQNACAICKC